ncbi:MAG: GNAT family N-acetyltransferase [Acidobacteria bacterium]|nr:GNAT family N-acetyltransferase [Acidobacteriota bacterium]MBE3131240.1 GNAT family N-acetyltransferase [Acidobacteriota bacterium]
MIRPMEPRDKEPVMDLIRETGFFTPAEVVVAEELIDVYLEDPEQKDYRIVVVENDRKDAVGYLTWGPTPLAEDAYDLYWMAVAPSEQGKGRGKVLVRWLEDEVRRRDGRMIIIETSSQPKYHGTRQFYIDLDYKEVARIPDYYRAGDDRVIYAKYFR